MTLKQIDRAAQRFADELMIPTEIPGALVPLIHDIAVASYKQGATDADLLQWNSVNDKLPQVDDPVLVFVPTIFKDIARFEVAYWDGEDWYTTVGEHISPSRWMTIPQLNPEKEER